MCVCVRWSVAEEEEGQQQQQPATTATTRKGAGKGRRRIQSENDRPLSGKFRCWGGATQQKRKSCRWTGDALERAAFCTRAAHITRGWLYFQPQRQTHWRNHCHAQHACSKSWCEERVRAHAFALQNQASWRNGLKRKARKHGTHRRLYSGPKLSAHQCERSLRADKAQGRMSTAAGTRLPCFFDFHWCD